MKKIWLLISATLFAVSSVMAQTPATKEAPINDTTEAVSGTNGNDGANGSGGKYSIVLGSTGGIVVTENDTTKKKKSIKFGSFNIDLGVNFMHDKTDYASAEAIRFLNVPGEYRNNTLFNLQQGNSWNFNLWLAKAHFTFVNSNTQKIGMNTGLGIQVFNFKYSKPISFSNDAYPQVNLRTDIDYKKNKLSVMYASIPLMFTGETRLSKKLWLHYGVGVIGGMNVSTWTKQRSKTYGRDKNHDMFNTERFQWSLQAEVGLADYFTLFGTYQMNSLFKDGVYQQPISIGIRL